MEELQSFRNEMFDGTDAKTAEIEEGSLKDSVKPIEASSNFGDKIQAEAEGLPADDASELQSTSSRNEILINTLSKDTEEKQNPTLDENTASVADSESPIETTSESSEEQDEQKNVNIVAKDKENKTQSGEISNFSSAPVADIKNDIREDKDDSSTEIVDIEPEHIDTDKKTSTLEVDDENAHVKSDENLTTSSLTSQEEKKDEQLPSLARQDSEESMDTAASLNDDNPEYSNLNKREKEDDKILNLAHQALEENMSIATGADNDDHTNLNKAEETQRLKSEEMRKETSPSKEVETIDSCETDLEKTEDKVASEPIELAANTNLIVREDQSSEGGNLKESLKEDDAIFNEIQTIEKGKNEDSSEEEQSAQQLEVETQANLDEQKVNPTKQDKLPDENNESVQSLEGSNKDYEEEATTLQETIEERTENNTKGVVESATTDDGQSIHFQDEAPIPEESLGDNTKNEQIDKSLPLALNVQTKSVTDSDNPTEPLLETSVEEDKQSREFSGAIVEETINETSEHPCSLVPETVNDDAEKKEDYSDQIPEQGQTHEDAILSKTGEQHDQPKFDENERKTVKSEDEEKDDKLSNTEPEALEESMTNVTTAEKIKEDSPEESYSNEEKDDEIFFNTAPEASAEDSNLSKAEEMQRLKSETVDTDGKETSPSKEVVTIDSCETDSEKREDTVTSEPIELAADTNLIVSENRSSQVANLKKASSEEDEAPFDEIQAIEKAENEEIPEGDQCGQQSEVETKTNPSQEKVEISKEDEQADVLLFLPSEEKNQAMPEKITTNEIKKANEEFINENTDEATEKSFTDDRADAEKKNITESEGFAVETSEGDDNETEVPVSEPKPQDHLGVSDGESHLPEIPQVYTNQVLQDQKGTQQGETQELNLGEENKEMAKSQQLTEEARQRNETVSLDDMLSQDVNETSHSGSSTRDLDVLNKCSPGEEIHGEETLKGGGDEDNLNVVVNEKAIEHSIPEKEESINEEATTFAATATSVDHLSTDENKESVSSFEDSNKEHDEGDAGATQENIEEMTETNANGVLEPATTDDDQRIYLQNQASIADDSLKEINKDEQIDKSLPLALDAHMKSVTDSDNPTEPFLETSVKENAQTREFSGAIVEETIDEVSETSENSGYLVPEPVDVDAEKKEDLPDKISEQGQTHVDTILSETKEQNEQPKFDENEGTIKSEFEEKDDKFSNTTEASEESITNVTTAAKIEEDSPEESFSNEWNEQTLALEERGKEIVKDEDAFSTIMDDQRNESPESVAEAREDAARDIEEDDKQFEKNCKFNSENKLESLDVQVNEKENEDSIASSPTDERNYGESNETPEKNIESKEAQMSVLDEKTINDDFHVGASKTQNEASNTLPLDQDSMTTETPQLTEPSCSADEEKNELIPEVIEAKECIAMEKLGEQCETEPKEQIHEDSSKEQYPIAEVQVEKKIPDDIVQRVSQDDQELSTIVPIEHTEEVHPADEGIRHPTSAEAEKEVSIDAIEVSDGKHNEETKDSEHQFDEQLTLESENGIDGQGAVENNINVELLKDEILGKQTSENTYIEDASTSAKESTEMKFDSKSDQEETIIQTEEPAACKEALDQDDEISVIENIDQSAEIQKPDEGDKKKGLGNNLQQGEQLESVSQVAKSNEDVMMSEEVTEEQPQFQEIKDGTNKLDPSKMEQDPRAIQSVSVLINDTKDSNSESQNTSVVEDENGTIGEVTGKQDEIDITQSTERDEVESAEEKSFQKQPTHVNKVTEETEAKMEESTAPYSTKAEEKLEESKEDQNQATMILQGVAIDERIPDTLVTDREEKEHGSAAETLQLSEDVFSSKEDRVVQDASATTDQNNTIADPGEKQNNETTPIEVIESNKIETSIEVYPEEQHATDASEEKGEKESAGHKELIENRLIEKEQSNDANIQAEYGGSTGYELTADHSVEKELDDEASTDAGRSGSMKQEALSTETQENLSKQTLSKEEIEEIVASHSLPEDKQLPEQTTKEIRVLNMDEKVPNPFANNSDTTIVDETLVDETCSIGYEDEKHHLEEHPIELKKGSEDKADVSLERPILASEAFLEPRQSGSIICEVPEYHLAKEETALNKQTSASEATQSQEASSPVQEFEDQQLTGQITDATTELDQDIKLIKTSSENAVEDFANNKEDEDAKVNSAELVDETRSIEMENIQEALAPQTITEDEQLRGTTIDDSQELNTQEKEQNPIPTSSYTATKGTFTRNEDEEKEGDLVAVDGTGYIADEDEEHDDEVLPIKLETSGENDAVLEGKHEEQKHASKVTMEGGESNSVSYEEVHPFIEEDETSNKQKITPEATDTQETSSQIRMIEDQQFEGHATDENFKKEVNELTMTSEIALEDFTGKEENDDNKGADGAGLMGTEDENQPSMLTNKHEIEGCPEGEQIHASEVSLDAGESGSRTYDELAQHPSMETKHAFSKQLAEVDGIGYMADEDENRGDEDQPIKLTESNKNGTILEDKHEEQRKHASEVTMEGEESGLDKDFVLSTRETSIEPTAAPNEPESCMIQDSKMQGISQHPIENEASSSIEIAPRDAIQQKELAPNFEAPEEILLHSKLQVDETSDASGSDGLHIIREEANSGSHIQNMAREEAGLQTLEEPEMPGIPNDNEDVKVSERSDIQLSPEKIINDADHPEQDSKGWSSDACDQLNPDKKIEESGTPIKSTYQAEIKDSATEPVDIAETTSTSDTTKQEGLTKDEDNQIKTIDEPTNVTTSSPVEASDEEVSGIGKNEPVEEKVKEVIELPKEDESPNIDSSLDEPSFKGVFQVTTSDTEEPQEQSASQEALHREIPPMGKSTDDSVFGEAAKSYFPEPELNSNEDSPSEMRSIDLIGEEEIDEVAERSKSSNPDDKTNFDTITNANEITTILDSVPSKHEPTCQISGTTEQNELSREISTDEEKHDKDSASLPVGKILIDESAGVKKELDVKVENNEDYATEQIDKEVESTLSSDTQEKEYLPKEEGDAIKIQDEPITATTLTSEKTDEEEVTGIRKNELVEEEVEKKIELPKEDNASNFDSSLDKTSFEGGRLQVYESDLKNPLEESTNEELSPREVPMEKWKDETALGDAATPYVLEPNSKQNEDFSTENKSNELKEEKEFDKVQEGEENEVAKLIERNLDTTTNADDIRAEIAKARIFDSSLEAVNPKYEPTCQVPVTAKQDVLSREILIDDEKHTKDSASFLDDGNFKDEDDGLTREIDSKVENAKISDGNLDSTETHITHSGDIEDNEKVGKDGKASTSAAEAKVDEATFADDVHVSEESEPKQDESSLVSVSGSTQKDEVKDINEADIVDKDFQLNETTSQAQEAEDTVAEEPVDETAPVSKASLESPTIETIISDGLPDASRLQSDDTMERIQDGSRKEEEEQASIITEEQPQSRLENADTSSNNTESATSADHLTQTTKEKEREENLQEAPQLESELATHETLAADETKSESTTGETNSSDDFVHVGKPEDEDNGTFSGSLSPQDEPMEPTDKSTDTTSEVLVENPVHENKKEDLEKEEEQDINAVNANSEVINGDAKSPSGMSLPEEKFKLFVSDEKGMPKDEQCSSSSNPETKDTIELRGELQKEINVKNVSAVIPEEKSNKEKNEADSVVRSEKVEETSTADSDRITEPRTPEKDAQGLPHSMDQTPQLEGEGDGGKRSRKSLEEKIIEEDDQSKNKDENVRKLHPDPVLVTSDAKETLPIEKDVEENNDTADADVEEKTDEEKEHEHKEEEPEVDAPVMVETSREVNIKPSPKKSHNLLSGVGSKVKHSISKVKKAITGKSSPSKSPAHKSG